MDTKILVVYASTHGSTQEVAEVVAGTLREHELTVDLQRARDIRTLEGYSADAVQRPARLGSNPGLGWLPGTSATACYAMIRRIR
jgi:hypothetical protein